MDCVKNIDLNFYKLVESNNLKVFGAVQEFIETLVTLCSEIFMKTDNLEIFLRVQYVYNFCRIHTNDFGSGPELSNKPNVRSILPNNDNFIKHSRQVCRIVETEAENISRQLKKIKTEANESKKKLAIVRMQVIFRFATDLGLQLSQEVIRKLYISLVQLVSFKNTKVTLLKETKGFDTVFDAHKLISDELTTDVDTYICSQLDFFDGNIEAFYGLKKTISQFSGTI